MSWVRYDDNFHHHDKVMQVRDLDAGALGLHVLANTWTATSKSPGWVPIHVPRQLVGGRGKKWAQILVTARLWDAGEFESASGWWVHDYGTYNPVDEATKQRRADAARKAANARWHPDACDTDASGHLNGHAASHAEDMPTVCDVIAETMPSDAIARGRPVPLPKPKEPTTGATSSTRGERNELWDAVVAACGINPAEITDGLRGSVGKAVADLLGVHATPSDVPIRARRYRDEFPHAALTAAALAKHWAALTPAKFAQPSNSPWGNP